MQEVMARSGKILLIFFLKDLDKASQPSEVWYSGMKKTLILVLIFLLYIKINNRIARCKNFLQK